MSSGQSLRNGSSVEPGLPNTLRMPNARNRSKVACLTVRGVVGVFLRSKVESLAVATAFTSPRKRGEGALLLPRRRALHGRLSFRIRRPCFHAVRRLVGIDRELAAFEQRLHSAIGEFLRHDAAQFGGELDLQRGLHRSVEDQTGITLDLGDVVAV